jgi:hypothetical protein
MRGGNYGFGLLLLPPSMAIQVDLLAHMFVEFHQRLADSDICIKEKSRFVRSTLLKIKANSEICIAKSVMKVIIIIGI